MEFIRLDDSDPPFLRFRLIDEPEKWEAYDFVTNEWVCGRPVEHLGQRGFQMFCLVADWPYPVSFLDSLRKHVAHLPDDTIVCYYESNESFGALRPRDQLH